MKFEFTPDEEWDSPSEPGLQQAQEGEQDAEGKQPLSPGALIATASERLHRQTLADFSRLQTSLNRMRYTVEASRSRTKPLFPESGPHLGEETFRPQAFRSRPLGDARG